MNDLLKEAHKHYPKTVPTRIIPPTHTVSDVFEAAVHDFPQNIAIDFLGREFTYKELYEQIKRAASVLSMCGVRRGDAVSLMLPNCPQHYVAFYALSYLGAVVSEHNPLAPPAQLKEQLERISPRVVVAWEQTAEKLAKAGVLRPYTCLAVDITRALPRKSQFLLKLPIKAAKKQRAKMRGKVPPEAYSWDDRVAAAYPMHFHPEMHSGQDDIAVLIQTGGTTGTPKAVALTHRNIVSNAAQVLLWLDSFKRGKETVGAVLPFFHAFGLQLSLSVCVSLAATQGYASRIRSGAAFGRQQPPPDHIPVRRRPHVQKNSESGTRKTDFFAALNQIFGQRSNAAAPGTGRRMGKIYRRLPD